jgi:hypothetical protein
VNVRICRDRRGPAVSGQSREASTPPEDQLRLGVRLRTLGTMHSDPVQVGPRCRVLPGQSAVSTGGGCGIRTREGVNPTRFPSVRHRPLGESSAAEGIVSASSGRINGARRDRQGQRRPLAHPAELTYPCCLPALGELGEMPPYEGLAPSLREQISVHKGVGGPD